MGSGHQEAGTHSTYPNKEREGEHWFGEILIFTALKKSTQVVMRKFRILFCAMYLNHKWWVGTVTFAESRVLFGLGSLDWMVPGSPVGRKAADGLLDIL